MKSVKKEISYRDQTIQIVVDVDAIVEKQMGGQRAHKVYSQIIGRKDVFDALYVADEYLESYLEKLEQSMKDYIDNLFDRFDQINERFSKIGYK